ncbi:hypothetical protein FA95DRAFT_1567255 [Auriscalpium vulgare]|uniref:Uncharacterized protein n=1 Tax=Auriscalpium vulgare TaxID=40419 RepID=A0ACB8R669_9AGAM|nr:hypothetical protein FA95DRAFT_1567255 [Auriscalpium vulgare]
MSPAASKSPSPTPEASLKAADVSPVDSASSDDVETAPTPPVASTSASAATENPASSSSNVAGTGPPTAGDWQAIWSPSHGAYYFFNAVTQHTTWENPVQSEPVSANPSTTTSPPAGDAGEKDDAAPGLSAPAALAQMYAQQEAAAAQGIDPALAHLDPTLAGSSAPGGAYSYTAKFNARTGAFAKPDGRDPTHLSEYERAKRMSEVYFDVGSWEQEVEARKRQEAEDEANGKKRKRPSKKDVERFKEQKRLKKIAKTAWLRT